MLLDFLLSGLLVTSVLLGSGWVVAARLPLPPVERLLASLVISLVITFLVAWHIYLFGLPAILLWSLPILTLGGLLSYHREAAIVAQDSDVQAVVIAQLLVTGWCLCWLALVHNYSGGGWVGDWLEHWQRTRFFVEHEPLDRLFLGQYALTARPPLVNVVTGALLQLTRFDFAHYQFYSTLLASLVFIPAALLAKRWGGRTAIGVFSVLLMLNPLFVQNTTFAWTKLPAAILILAALVFFLRARHDYASAPAAGLFGLSMASGLLAHYSAAPYAILLALGWMSFGWAHWRCRQYQLATIRIALAGGLLLAFWLGWAIRVYGPTLTFFGNTSATETAGSLPEQMGRILLNLRDTLVPHFLRETSGQLLDQGSPIGRWRDWWFQLYQLNLLFAFGSVGWLAIGREAWRTIRGTPHRQSVGGWVCFVIGCTLLGVGLHGARDTWGLTHICLQALVVLGLAFLASRWTGLGRSWRRLLGAGLILDFLCGIGLHFGVQSGGLDRRLWAGPAATQPDWAYTLSALVNLRDKQALAQPFFSEALNSPTLWVWTALGALLFVAIVRAFRVARVTSDHV